MSLIAASLLISFVASLWLWLLGLRNPRGWPWLTGFCLVLLLLLPLLTCLPKWHFELVSFGLGGENVAALMTGVAAGDSGHHPVHGWAVLQLVRGALWFWLAGVALMLVRMVMGRVSLRRWVNQSSALVEARWQSCLAEGCDLLQLGCRPDLRSKKGLRSPVVSGIFRPVILMPEDADRWKEETCKMAILHELGHLKRRDLWLRFAAEVTCALHWYNPLVWWMKSRLLTQCEYACDARVVAAGVSRKRYLAALCDVLEWASGERQPAGVVAMSGHAPLSARATCLFNSSKGSRAKGQLGLAFFAAACTCGLTFGLSVVRPAVVGEMKVLGAEEQQAGEYSAAELELRHRADPFPGN